MPQSSTLTKVDERNTDEGIEPLHPGPSDSPCKAACEVVYQEVTDAGKWIWGKTVCSSTSTLPCACVFDPTSFLSFPIGVDFVNGPWDPFIVGLLSEAATFFGDCTEEHEAAHVEASSCVNSNGEPYAKLGEDGKEPMRKFKSGGNARADEATKSCLQGKLEKSPDCGENSICGMFAKEFANQFKHGKEDLFE